MENETEVAASSPAPMTIPASNTPEYTEWRTTGKLPEPKETEKPAESSAADAGKQPETEDKADSAALNTQEKQGKRRPDVEERIKQLTDKHRAETETLRRELEEARKPKTEKQAESSPAKPSPPQNYKEWRAAFKPSAWMEQYGKDNPDSSYEEASAAMADYLGDVRDQFRTFEQQRDSQQKALQTKVEEARARYGEKFDEVLQPTVTKIMSDAGINPNVKEMLNDSDVIADLLYTLGTDPKLDEFVAMAKNQPGKAIRYLAAVERGIIDELGAKTEAGKETERNERGQFVKPAAEPPVKRGPESAPAPPIEIGSRGSSTMSDSDRALKDMASDPNAFSRFRDAENRKDLERRRGR